MKKYYVVSDVFESMSDNQNILTFSQLMLRLLDDSIDNAVISLEQGISEEQYLYLKNIIRKDSVKINSYFDQYARCDGQLTHKSKAFNTLISDPIEIIKSKKYESAVLIDERCAELSDHTTGKHVQLMVLVEAARQMVLAVTEKFFIPIHLRRCMSFVGDGMETEFKRFALPFFISLRCEIENQRILPGNNITNVVKVYFLQEEQVIAELKLKSKVFCKQFLAEKEQNFIENYVYAKEVNEYKQVANFA